MLATRHSDFITKESTMSRKYMFSLHGNKSLFHHHRRYHHYHHHQQQQQQQRQKPGVAYSSLVFPTSQWE